MTIYSIPPFLSAVLFLVFGVYVLIQNPKGKVNRPFFLWCVLTAIWQGSWARLFNVQSPQVADVIIKAGYSAILFLHPASYQFVMRLLNVEEKEAWLIRFFYASSAVFLILNWTTSNFISGHYQYAWGYYPKAGMPFHPLYLAVVFICAVKGPMEIHRKLKSATLDDVSRNQLKYVCIAVYVYYAAAIDFLTNYGFNIYPIGVFFIVISTMVFTLAIVRYHLLSVSTLLRRIGVAVIIYAILLAAVFPVLLKTYDLFGPTAALSKPNFFLIFLSLCFVVSLGPVIYAQVVRRQFWLKGHMTTGLTHELKSPVATIQSALDVLRMKMENKSADNSDLEYLDMIQANADRLEKNVADLLNIAKIQAGAVQITVRHFSFVALVREIVARLKLQADMKNITFVCNMPDACDINADAEKISLVVSNLVANAIKYTGQGEIRINVDQSIGQVCFRIVDQGRGIPAEELKKVFERFFQGKGVAKGAGLGLAVSKAFVEAHGGTIGAESDGEGKGSCFWFTLPR
jgi:signal transduction histidine kinase